MSFNRASRYFCLLSGAVPIFVFNFYETAVISVIIDGFYSTPNLFSSFCRGNLACNIALDAVKTVALDRGGRKEIDIKNYAKVEKVSVDCFV